jgi:hypothetical protein
MKQDNEKPLLLYSVELLIRLIKCIELPLLIFVAVLSCCLLMFAIVAGIVFLKDFDQKVCIEQYEKTGVLCPEFARQKRMNDRLDKAIKSGKSDSFSITIKNDPLIKQKP